MTRGYRRYLPLLILPLLAACTGFGGGQWPNLSDNFETRPDPQTITQTVSAPEKPEAPANITAPTLATITALRAEIEVNKSLFEKELSHIKSASETERQKFWFSAQLILSRINTQKDGYSTALGGVNDAYLEDLKAFTKSAEGALITLNPSQLAPQ